MKGFKKLFRNKRDKNSVPRPYRPDYLDPDVQPRLPRNRARALTLQAPGGQQRSSLFLSLPLEIRLQIYDLVLGHRKMHVAFEFSPREYRKGKKKDLQWRWWHCVCTWDQTTDDRYWDVYYDQCRFGKIDGQPGPPDGMMGKVKLDFAILLTCRQVYSEAIDILYSTTTFNFHTHELLASFSSLVLPHRFERISSIEMPWDFLGLGLSVIPDKDKKLYRDMWTVLSEMPNLRHLAIAVVAHECRKPPPADLEEVWLGPPKLLGKRDFFQVGVPFSYMKHLHAQDLNFQLVSFHDIVTAISCFCTGADYD